MFKKLESFFIQRGFRQLPLKHSALSVLYLAAEAEIQLLFLIDYTLGDEITAKQLADFTSQVKMYFYKEGIVTIKIMNLIITTLTNQSFSLLEEDMDVWFIDPIHCRLLVFENQPADYFGIKKELEKSIAFSEPSIIQTIKNFISPCNFILVLLIVLSYFVISFLDYTNGMNDFQEKGALSWYPVIELKQYYRLLTYLFLHADFSHLMNNMFLLLFIGTYLELAVHKLKYLVIYFASGILAGLTSVLYNYLEFKRLPSFETVAYQLPYSIGASGAVFGVVGAFAYIVIRNKGKLEGISSKRMLLFVFLSLYGGFTSAGIDNAAHVGGLLSGFFFAIILYRHHQRLEESM